MYKIKAGNQEFEIEPKSKSYEGIVNGENYNLDVSKEDNGFHIIQNNKSFNVSVVSADYEAKTFEIMVNGNIQPCTDDSLELQPLYTLPF